LLGIARYLGWSQGILKDLYEERRITVSGHETTDTDPGAATSRGDHSLDTYILGRNRYQIEMLTNLADIAQRLVTRGLRRRRRTPPQ
jgi:kynurenine formamidase